MGFRGTQLPAPEWPAFSRPIAAAALVAGFLLSGSALPATLPDRAELSLPDLTGDTHSIECFSGSVIVLNFWATWCAPCREEWPLLAEMHERFADRDVVIIAASTDAPSTRSQIEPFLAEFKTSFPVWTGATAADMERFGLPAAVPATAIISPEGRIEFRIIGLLKRRGTVKRIEYLLSGGRGSRPKRYVNSMPRLAGRHEDDHEHGDGEGHGHGGVGMEGASLVPS